MNIEQLKEKNLNDLNDYLLILYKKRLKLIFEKNNTTTFKNNHILKKIKKNLARTLTIIKQKKRDNI